MTSLIGWVGIDSRAPASIYLASDSRISWGTERTWDLGRKLFASRNYPEILAYCGDVLFPTQVLGQTVDLIDNDLCISQNDSPEERKQAVFGLIRNAFSTYPIDKLRTFTIVYCTRQYEGMDSIFQVATLKWSPSVWSERWLQLPAKSGVIETLGSGSKTISKWIDIWSNTTEKGTSRSVFGAFCDSIQSGEDRLTGGAPQLVGIYRKGPARSFGIIHQNKRYLLGLPVDASAKCTGVEWRNCLFERCDWNTMKTVEGAQKHKRPRGLGKALE